MKQIFLFGLLSVLILSAGLGGCSSSDKTVEEENLAVGMQAVGMQEECSSAVYVTPHGKCYHSSMECPTLSRSRTILPKSVEEAQMRYRPCKVCH